MGVGKTQQHNPEMIAFLASILISGELHCARNGNNYHMPLKCQAVTSTLSACIKILAQVPELNTGLQLAQQVHCVQWVY